MPSVISTLLDFVTKGHQTTLLFPPPPLIIPYSEFCAFRATRGMAFEVLPCWTRLTCNLTALPTAAPTTAIRLWKKAEGCTPNRAAASWTNPATPVACAGSSGVEGGLV